MELFAEETGIECKNSCWVTGTNGVAMKLDVETRSRFALPLCSA